MGLLLTCSYRAFRLMKNLLSQSKAIILIIKDFQVQLFSWENKALTFVESYADYQDGQDRFEEFLKDHADYPLVIVNDVIEESFRNETVVHVAATDRKALLDRKLNYSFRSTLYRAARITGREDSGRRDGTVMLSAITKPELVNPWAEKVLSEKIAVQSVSSVAYLTESSLGKADAKSSEHLMIVSLEEGANLRQTYLRKGRVLFSRLTTLPTTDPAALGASIYQESLQIRQYLERIRLLSYESPIEVRVYTPYEKSVVQQNLTSSNLNSFACFNTADEAINHNIDLKGAEPTGLYLFLAQVLQKARIENVYGYFDLRRYFHLKMISQGLVFAASAAVVVSMAVKIPTLSDVLDKNSLREVVESQSAPLRAEYERLTQRFPETPIDSKEMALVVETYETIEKQSYMPMDAMGLVAEAMTSAPELQISKIEWSLVETELEVDDGQGFFGYAPPQPIVAGAEFTQAVLDERSELRITVEGVAYSPRSYREAQDQVLAFVEALEEYPGVSVIPVKMPTDVRVDTQVFTTVDDDELRAAYTLEITMEQSE